jgi:cytochrome c553
MSAFGAKGTCRKGRKRFGPTPENTVKTRMFYAQRHVGNLLNVAELESSLICARSGARSVVCADLRRCLPKEGIFKLILWLAIIFLLLATSAGLAQDRKANSLEERGWALAERMCSACHAVGKSGESPHVGAPPFRALDRRVELDSFTERLREGLTSDRSVT